ncbi:tRNA (cytosine(72)-C(5))-methyltransferase NSUN6 isoform X2 [Rattus norvegicus]|uniref:tRNA (cytosine(72)-C(5))-methyltransferase NSUN6 isoform X2 n=1 Tax=Rattus norvegicus TaxID=10116 RepID=UPI0003D0FC72|nr:tRNA (cytosine(72)-C(5))-methyltransferase NSUN6 isoform X2 [Rattus norvegicus]|eukprot:XP_017456061.1 PREDICTED: putative methyltransferase NSUN6 isoform X3 [Rattus norvegicus]
MYVFPKISLRPEVENYLKESFLNEEVVSASSQQEAERNFETLLLRLSHPPLFTTVRVNTHLGSVEHVRGLLLEELQKQFGGSSIPVLQHPALPDVLLIPMTGPRGIGIRMTEPIYLSPSFDNVLSGYIFLQNLPSTVVAHVLDPQPGEKILDLCAAPGGKTTHIAALMRDQGEVIALDKILTKVTKLKQNASLLGLHSIRAFCFDATKALKLEVMDGVDGAPPFLPESFDRILLDAPCSGLGQRPNMACTWTLKEVTSYQPLQRKLLNVAVRLLKPGGVLVYSTCTVTLAENEEQVAWALRTFPCLQLQPQEPQIGGEGMLGAGLSLEQLKQLQRFDPCVVPLESMDTNSLGDARREDVIWLANKDCIGFFIAKFLKCQSTERKVSRK